jgi:carboxymethylenebutenolidase
MRALLSREKNAKQKLPGIIVVHENRGLNPYIEDVGRRRAVEGFITIAPDALTPFGGYPGNDNEGRTLQKKRDRDEMLEDFIAAFDYLYDHPECNGCIGVIGFFFGGSISNKMAARVTNLKAAVPFYGGQLSAEDTAKIKAPLQLHYAELDKHVNAGWPDYEAALKENNKEYTAYTYASAKHGLQRLDLIKRQLNWPGAGQLAFLKKN